MGSPRVMGSILIAAAAITMVGGLIAFILNQSFMNRQSQNILMIDSGFLGLFAITHGILLLKIKDVTSSTVAEASSLTTMGTVGSALSLGILGRMITVFFGRATMISLSLIIIVALVIISIITIGSISVYIAKKQVKRVQPEDSDYVVMETPYNKYIASVISIIFSLFLFGVSVFVYINGWLGYHVVATSLHAVMLFANGVLGVVACQVKVAHFNFWHKTFTSYTLGIGVASTVALVQVLVYTANQFKYPRWQKTDFTILIISQAALNLLGLAMSAITSAASDDIQTLSPKYSKAPINDKTNAGMYVSAILASGIAVFNIGIMNYPTYGFPVLIVTAMVLVASKQGTSIQTTGNELAKYPYYTLNVFNSLGNFWAISMTVYEFLATSNYTTSLSETFRIFPYIFGGLNIATLLPVTYFCVSAAVRSYKALNDATTGSKLSVV